jgi:hypothetical protein
MVCALQERQFWHEWHSALGAASGGIWGGGIIHYKLLERNLTVTAELYCQQLRRLTKQSSKNARVDDMEWFLSMTTPDHTLQTRRKRPFRNSTGIGDSSTSTLLSGPYPIGLPSLPLSLQQSARNFLQQGRWAPKLARRDIHCPNRRISSSVGSKTFANVSRQSWTMEENTKLNVCYIICVKMKLFISVETPHERMHQPSIWFFYPQAETLQVYADCNLTKRFATWSMPRTCYSVICEQILNESTGKSWLFQPFSVGTFMVKFPIIREYE